MVSTDKVPAAERFTFWREVSSKAWMPKDAHCEAHLAARFRAQVAIGEMGPVQWTLLTTTPYSVRRTPELIRRCDPETFLLSCTIRGHVVMEQNGRQADFAVGDLGLYHSSRPYLGRLLPAAEPSRLLILSFPRSSLPLPPRDLHDLTTVRMPGDRGIGSLSSRILRQLARHLPKLSDTETSRLSTLALDVLTLALADALGTEGLVPPHARQRALTTRIHAFIHDNLSDPRLTPGTIAAAHHISRSYLHKLFRRQGRTVAGYIRERRLERCRRDLADPLLAAHPIHAIAARWGFTSPAHFSQAFRDAYGLSPRQFRRDSGTVHPD
ncbi:Transcriptional regulator, AraC family [[Actinomadura] parvosata subsp. kistnae]|uniref:helix-turn-helix domain-containing protein n=1 Tax=[Actinomadura] parvosata TaxID=1955412 RepID=UPI000D2A9DA8|nr:helix-turn-helix domain-containing protein [Nonomuraea sp. ATCC 55076]SPL95978.1 Transcriptional regulator, AraC family [Actinomadura parvosata subsp. kistnae]